MNLFQPTNFYDDHVSIIDNTELKDIDMKWSVVACFSYQISHVNYCL
jgi:hypothetical protein